MSSTAKLAGVFILGAVLATGVVVSLTPRSADPVETIVVQPASQPAVQNAAATQPTSPQPAPPAQTPRLQLSQAKPSAMDPLPAPAPPAPAPSAGPNTTSAPPVAIDKPALPLTPDQVPAPPPAPPQPEPRPRLQPEPEVSEAAPPRPPADHPASKVTVQLHRGDRLPIRLNENVSTDHYFRGDRFIGSLDNDLVLDGYIVADRGSRIVGEVVELARPDRTTGQGHLSLALLSLTTSDGQRIDIHTAPVITRANANTRNDIGAIGAGAGIGAVIGAAAGGGKGAAIGAVAGGALGAGSVMLSRDHEIRLPAETRLNFYISEPVSITER